MTATTVEPPLPETFDTLDPPVALVVEDDPEARAHLVKLLRGDGWSVREAPDTERGLWIARECVPDVVLLDLALPGMSGLDMLRIVKSWSDQPTRVVVVSFYSMLMRLPDLRIADATVQKPFTPRQVLDAARHQLVRSVKP